MNQDQAKTPRVTDADKTYQVENRCFVVHRHFGSSQTAAQLFATEISSGLFQHDKLKSQCGNDIIEP